MRIVHVEDFFHPDAGYQINILTKHQVMQGHEVIIVTSEMDKMPGDLIGFFGKDDIARKDATFRERYGVEVIRHPIYKYYSGRSIYKLGHKRLIDSLKPDVLYVHGEISLVAMSFILRVAKLPYPLILDSHMLEMASRNKFSGVFNLFYRKFITPIIIGEAVKVIRTQNDNYVEKCLGIPLTQAPYISFGSDTSLFKPSGVVREEFRREYNINQNDFAVLYAGKLDESKGGMLLAQAFVDEITNMRNRDVVLIVVGKTVGEYGDKVSALLSKSRNRIIRVPTQKYVELPKFYQSVDLVVYPRQCSLSFFDAQACGVPVLSEDNSVNTERLSHGNGLTFRGDDVEDFRGKLRHFIEMNDDQYTDLKRNSIELIKNHYDYADIARQYSSIVSEELDSFLNKRAVRTQASSR